MIISPEKIGVKNYEAVVEDKIGMARHLVQAYNLRPNTSYLFLEFRRITWSTAEPKLDIRPGKPLSFREELHTFNRAEAVMEKPRVEDKQAIESLLREAYGMDIRLSVDEVTVGGEA